MVRPGLAVLFVAFFSATATAQTTVVTGTVVDARTGQALANVGALVFVMQVFQR